MENIQKIPPNDIDAEQAVLSSMFYEKDAVLVAYESIKGEDFYQPNNKAIFDCMIELFVKNLPVDLVTVKDKLVTKGVFEQVGGMEYISILLGGSYTSANIRQYVNIVKEKSLLRSLIRVSNDISNASYSGNERFENILDLAGKSIFEISQNVNTQEFAHVKDIIVESVGKIEEIFISKAKITGLETGFIDIDHMTAGLQKSDLILIAARPSMGKSALGINIAQYVSVRKNIPCAIFSLEMSKEQLVNRMLCTEAMIDAQKLRTGELNDDDWNKIIMAMGSMSKAPIYIDDTPGITVMEIRSKCRKLKLERGLGLIVIDYLQLMSGSSKSDSRQQEISEISRSLKAIAREMDVPVIALSQLSRACEARKDHRPMLSDLRESGAIEQDADIVSFIYRDEYYDDASEEKGMAEIIIAKQRNGPTGTVKLRWLGQYTKFSSLESH